MSYMGMGEGEGMQKARHQLTQAIIGSATEGYSASVPAGATSAIIPAGVIR